MGFDLLYMHARHRLVKRGRTEVEGQGLTAGELIAGTAIRIFGRTGHLLRSIADWNDPSLWRGEFDGLADGPDFIAESFLGEQYRVIDGRVVRWNIETGESQRIEASWEDWLLDVRADPESEVAVWLLEEWQLRYRSIKPTEHLAPKQPFVLGGGFHAENLYAVESASNLRWHAQLARQLRDVPDGAEVRVTVRWDD
jgi:hypothetical protein